MGKKITALLSSLLLLVFASSGFAENATHSGEYTVHHNAFLTVDLSPEMASRYHIRRSPNRAMLNISIIKEKAGTTGTGVTAEVIAQARNLRGQVRRIPLREIKEENAVYYIGEFLVENLEQVTFTIEAIPNGSDKKITASFKQQFYTH